MLHIQLICIGTLKESFLKENFAEYEKRLSHFCHFQLVQLPEKKIMNEGNKKEIQLALAEETEMILEKLPKNGYLIPLCIEGNVLSSEKFAQKLESVSHSHSHITFIIGSSHGLSEKIKSMSQFPLSVSAMTFPHQLFRIMLMEQIYRSFTITHHIKYHK